MKTIIAGTRNARQPHVDAAMLACPFADRITEVVSGKNVVTLPSGAKTGADYYGELWAKDHGLPVTEFPADWKANGRAAGPIRNWQMAQYADALVLVWDGKSRGSKDMLSRAKGRGLTVWIWYYLDEEGESIGGNHD